MARGLWYRQWTRLRREGSEGSKGAEGSKGGGIALRAMSFIIPLRGMENRTTGLTPEGNAPLFPCGDFPRRGKFALLPASELISTSMHSTAKSSPSGGKVVPKVPKGVHFLRAIGAVVRFFLCYCPICKLSPPPSTKGDPLPQAAFITPSEPARSVGGTHRSARSARTIEPGRRRRLNPLAFRNTAHRRRCLHHHHYSKKYFQIPPCNFKAHLL